MNTQRVLTVKAGETVDIDLVKFLINQGPTAFGFAVQATDGSEPELSIVREDKAPTLSDILGILNEAKAFNSLLYFGYDGKIRAEDVQPFIIDDVDEKVFIAIGLEGDFSKHADPKSGHTEAYNLAQNVIIPRILEVLELTDANMTKVRKELESDTFNTLFLSNVDHRGSLTILGLDGDPIWRGKNELGNDYAWGQISNEYGYDTYLANLRAAEEKRQAEAEKRIKDAAAPKVEEKKPNRFFRGKAVTDKPVASGTPPIVPQDVATPGTAPRASVPSVKQVGATTVVNTDVKRQPIRPPEFIHKNDDKKKWYLLVGGSLPAMWRNKIAIIPVIDNPPQNEAEFLQLQADAKKKDMSRPVIADVKPIEQPKTATSAGTAKTAEQVKAREQEENIPIIAAADMDKIIESIATNATRSMTVSEMQALEKKLDKFSVATATTLSEMASWPASAWFAIGKQDHRAVVMALMEAFSALRANMKLEDLVNTDKDTVTTTVTKHGDGTTKTESIVTKHVLAKEELEPEKKAGIGRFRARTAA